MDEEVGQRSRHNSSRSRHGSGLSRHESGRSRHGSGDLWKRLDGDTSPKLSRPGRDSPRNRPGKAALVNGDDDRIALINGGPVENGIGESPQEECNGHCTGHCGGLCTPKLISNHDPPLGKNWPVKSCEMMPGYNQEHPRSNLAPVVSGALNGKKTSDSEGESDCPGNGIADGEDDQQLLLKTNKPGEGGQLPTSPPWKNRTRHLSTEGLRRRTRSRSDSESSEPVLTTGTIGEHSGIALVLEHKSTFPSSAPSRRRRTSSKCSDGNHCESGPIHHGSLGSALSHVKDVITAKSPKKCKCSQDSVNSMENEDVHNLQDNPSFAHNNSSGNSDEEEANLSMSHTLGVNPNHAAIIKSTSDVDKVHNHSSPGPDERKMLISGNAQTTSPKPSQSPRPRLGLNLPHVCRPRDDSDPPLPIVHQDDSFTPQNHMDANMKLNEVKLAITDERIVQNGNVWQMRTLPESEIKMNGHVPSDKNVDFTSPVSSTSHSDLYSKSGRCQAYATLAILLLANLINYMDRVTIAGVLLEIKQYYNISNGDAGLLQTSFIVSYMVLSPIFGYLGDRYNRKLIMAVGIFFWSAVTLAGSFVPRHQFWLFLVMRGCVGIGEASYSTIAPTIIADLFVRDMRTKALAVFYFAIPVGSGLGYIVGSYVAKALNGWQWALRVTPGLGVICVLCIIFVVREPPRGAAEGGTHLGNTTWLADISYLVRNKSFVFSSLGFTCVAFVAGALALWAPTFMYYSLLVQGDYMSESKVSLIFGVITCGAGFLGVGFGSESARRIRKKTLRADPLVCAFGLLCCTPFLYFTIVVAKYNTTATWVLIFLGETFLCLNWAIVTDILLYIVIPTRRSTAEAVQILLSHALGDAGSPYLIGVLSDSIQNTTFVGRGAAAKNFLGLQYALYMTAFVAILGGGFFLATAVVVIEDRARAEKAVRGSTAVTGKEADEDNDSDDAMITGPLSINADIRAINA